MMTVEERKAGAADSVSESSAAGPIRDNSKPPAQAASSAASGRVSVRRADVLAGVLLGGLVAAFVFFVSRRLFTIPAPLGDEPWLMQTANELIANGKWGLPMNRLVGGNIENVWMTMPGLFVSLAAFFKVFGVGLEQARAYNVTAASLLLAVVFLIGRKLHSRAAGLIAVFALAFDGNFFHHARIFRNDIPTVACAMAAFYLYLRAQTAANGRREWGWGLVAGFLTAFSVLIHPNGLYMFGVVALWTLLERGFGFFKSKALWAFAVGALVASAPCGIYVALHWGDFLTQWRPESVHYRGTTLEGLWRNLGDEWWRYDLWRPGVLGIPTSDVVSFRIFQFAAVLSLAYLVARAWKTFARLGGVRGVFEGLRRWAADLRDRDSDRARFFESETPEMSTTGSLQRWMLRQGGWRRRLSLALHDIEEESKPITNWLDALGRPSHPAWRVPRFGLLVVTLATVAFFAAVDTQKSPAYLPYMTSWFALCCGVANVDGIRWGLAQRKRSARRVMMGLAVLAVVLVPTLWYVGSSSRAVWRFYRWSRTFEPAPYRDLAEVLRRVVPPGTIPVGRPVHWLSFMDNPLYLTTNKRLWKENVADQPLVLIVDENVREKDNFKGNFEKQVGNFTLLAELSDTLYGDIQVYYTGPDGRFRGRVPERYYFFGDYGKGYGRRGFFSEEERQSAKVIWLAGPNELERIARETTPPDESRPSVQRDGERTALRVVTDVSKFNTKARLPIPQLKPFTIYRLQTAVHVSEGGCLVGPRDRTGLWLTDPASIAPGDQYVPVDIVFSTNARGDGELAVSNRRDVPAASLIFLGQVELREIGPLYR